MASTVKFAIPHSLGRAEARRRIDGGLPKLEQHIPGGGTVRSSWMGDDKLALDITAMGQKVRADMVVEETAIVGSVTVPLMLAMMSGAIGEFIKSSAEKMLTKP